MELEPSSRKTNEKNEITEEDSINMNHRGKQKAEEPITSGETFSQMGHPHGAFLGDTSQRRSSVVLSPSKHLDAGTSSLHPRSDTPREESAIDVKEPTSSVIGESEGGIDPFSDCRALLDGSWKDAKLPIEGWQGFDKPEIRQRLLYIAIVAKQTAFVEKLTKLLPLEDLVLKTIGEDTALHVAVSTGATKVAQMLVKRRPNLLCIRSKDNFLPVYVATLLGQKEMASDLFAEHETLLYDPSYGIEGFEYNDVFPPDDLICLFTMAIARDMYDLAREVMKWYQPDAAGTDLSIAAASDRQGKTALHYLAEKPLGCKSEQSIAKRWTKRLSNWGLKSFKKLPMVQSSTRHRETVSPRALLEDILKNIQAVHGPNHSVLSDLLSNDSSPAFDAVEAGNVEFLIILVHSHPDLIWKLQDLFRKILRTSLLKRQEGIFKLIKGMGALTNLIAFHDKNNILHLAGELPIPDRLNVVPGAAFQMQRELWWFKKIEEIVPPSFSQAENNEGSKPKDIFAREHTNLRRDAENWMKDTANYSMLVATLIATVVFAAVFTTPGESHTGSSWFLMFFISNAIAFLFSASSILTFLSILTARYTDDDFLESLPKRLVVGLTTLSLSVVSMLLTFSAACFLIYENETRSIPGPLIVLAAIPVILFVRLHYKLVLDVVRSTYGSRFLFQSGGDGPFLQRYMCSEG